MRNAAAHFDDDFAIEAPARKKASGRSASSKPAGKRKKKGKSRFAFATAFDMHKVARYAAIGMSVTVAVGIMVNALLMQKGRHPAPLFAAADPVAEAAPKPAAKVAPAKPAPTKVDETPPAPVARPAESRAAAPESDAAPTRSDAIGRLIQNGSIPADRADGKGVLDAQRALVKLGFALKPTGTFGPQTKKALERFEKDHHLPVRGELSRKTVKALAAASGLKIEH